MVLKIHHQQPYLSSPFTEIYYEIMQVLDVSSISIISSSTQLNKRKQNFSLRSFPEVGQK